MNRYSKLIVIMAALSAGSALAAGGTPAGTAIPNQATATYSDASGTPVSGGSSSNIVTTTVASVPVFDITPNDSSTDPGPHPNTPGQTKVAVVPGAVVTFPYTVNNYGNTPVQVALSTIYSLNGVVSGSSNIDPTTVKYYVDSNSNGILDGTEGTAPVTSVTVANNALGTGAVKIIQQYTVPSTATAGSQIGADPVGSGTFPSAGATSTTFDTTAPVAGSSGTYLNQDANNFNQVTLNSPTLTNNPPDGNPGTSTTVDPSPTNVTPPGGTPVPGYTAPTDPNSPGTTPIVQGLSGNEQKAYPPADSNATSDVVRFNGTVVNSGTLSDTVNLFPTDVTGAPIGTNTGGIFSAIPGLPAGTTVQFLDSTGTALPLVNGYPTLTVPAGGQANYITKITYSDSDAAALPVITVTIGADSGNDAGVIADATSKDSIYPPSQLFGDATGITPAANPAPAPNVDVYPGTPAAGLTDGALDNRAVFLMDVANTGTYPEAYTLVGTVSVPLTTGSSQTVSVSYYTDVNSNGSLDAGDTLLSGGVTPSVAAGSDLKVLALVDVPSTALLDGVAKAISQTATGNTSGSVRTDINDTITVKISGIVDVKKYADNCSTAVANCPAAHVYADTPANATAKPAEFLRYELIAKNNTNTNVQGVILTDDFSVGTRTNLTLVSLSAAPSVTSAKVLYRLNNGAWTAISGTTALPVSTTGAKLEFWYDGNGNGLVDSGVTDTLPIGESLRIDINTQVN